MKKMRVSEKVRFEKTEYGAVLSRDEANESIKLTNSEIRKLARLTGNS